MELVKELADGFMILIRAGAVLRLIYCFIKMGSDEEGYGSHKKKAMNTVGFYILAELIWQIKEVVLGYYN